MSESFEDIYEERFKYVEDKELRKHMWDAFRFVAYLLVQLTLDPDFPDMIRKTCILYTWALIEANINYLLKTLWYIEYTSNKEWEYKNTEILKDDINGKTLFLANRNRKVLSLEWWDFNLLNWFCKKEELYWEQLFKEINYARKLRNKIHISNLEDIDRKVTDTQLNRVIDCAREVFKLVESKV